jgi:hypothetical protein
MFEELVFEGVHFPAYLFDLETNEIVSLKRKTEPFLKKQWFTIYKDGKAYGYHFIQLYLNKRTKRVIFHRLVYQMNNPKQDIKGSLIEHIDGDRTNNNISNLRLVKNSK